MNIFMFVNFTPSDKSLGITKKISSEIQALRRLGHDVVYTAYGKNGVYIYGNDDSIIFEKRYKIRNNLYIRLVRYFLLIKTAQVYCCSRKQHFDILYGRLLAPTKKYINLLRYLRNNNSRVILEAHAYFPGIQFPTVKGKFISYMLKKNGPKLKSYVNKVLTEGRLDEFYGIPVIQEARIGVETEKICPHNYTGSRNELNLISVANEMPYHAYDRVIKSLGKYYQDVSEAREIKIHLVGSISSDTRRLVKNLHLEEKVFLYGKQFGDTLDRIYDGCNMALGPLGQHRIGGKKDTGLKTKEYFAKGIPYIYSGEEPSVPNNYPYIFRCESDESFLDFQDIWNFYLSYRDSKTVVDEMRGFAKKNYSWDVIMEEAIK